MNTTTTWTKFSERLPEESDLPVLLWNARVPKAKYTATKEALRCQLTLVHCFTHWMPAPPPPPRELDQAEKDAQAMERAWINAEPVCGRNGGGWFAEGFERGLKYERAEVAKELAQLQPMLPEDHQSTATLLKRVGLDK